MGASGASRSEPPRRHAGRSANRRRGHFGASGNANGRTTHKPGKLDDAPKPGNLRPTQEHQPRQATLALLITRRS